MKKKYTINILQIWNKYSKYIINIKIIYILKIHNKYRINT